MVWHFAPGKDKNAWEFYDARDGLPRLSNPRVTEDKAKAISLAQNGAVWIATSEHATRCVFAD